MKTLLKTHGKKITAVSITMAMFLLSGFGGGSSGGGGASGGW
jgi:uncharacterized membrane protein YgcG